VRSGVAPLAGVVAIVACAAIASAQGGGKPATGNPTPGTAQPDPPNVAGRVMFVGCLHAAGRAATDADANTPSNSRFELTKAESVSAASDRAPATRSSIKTYRLHGIDSQFSPFVGAKVEISGEVKSLPGGGPPTLVVEFVQRLAGKC
jgi:hypothetical protein